MLNFFRNVRGYIGPIGDDLPSLIPLVFALTIFFATFSSTINLFEKKNTVLDQDLDALKIARVMRGNGYYANIEQFNESCELVKTQDVYFLAFITPLPNPDEPYNFSVFEQSDDELVPKDLIGTPDFLVYDKSSSSSPVPYICPEDAGATYRIPFSGSIFSEAKLIQRVFPIAVETTNSIGVPYVQAAQLVVIAWH